MTEFEQKEIFSKIAAIVANKLKIDENTITQDSTLQDLGADSLDLVEIIMKLEDEFDTQIDDEKAEKLHNIRDVVTYIYALKHEQSQ